MCILLPCTLHAQTNEPSDQGKLDMVLRQMQQMQSQFQQMQMEINQLKEENRQLKNQVGSLPAQQTAAIDDKLLNKRIRDELERSRIDLPESAQVPLIDGPSPIRFFGSAVGVVQASMGNNPQDTTNAEGSFDLFLEADIIEGGIVFVDLEAIGNDGPDSVIGSYSGINGDAGSTDNDVTILEAYYEQLLFDDKLIFTIGKIDQTNYFDTNAVANDENTQFLAGAFVNSAVLDVPGNGPGVRATYSAFDWLDIGMGLQSGDEDGSFVFDRICWISELAFHTMFFDKPGNYRVYMTVNGNRTDVDSATSSDESVGFGISADQQISETVTWFGRVGFRDDHLQENQTEWAWSTGFQVVGPLCSRPEDILGVAIGQTQPNSEVVPNLKRTTFDTDETGANQNDYMASIETISEMYYSILINEQFTVSPLVQMVFNPSGDQNEDSIFISGLRANFNF